MSDWKTKEREQLEASLEKGYLKILKSLPMYEEASEFFKTMARFKAKASAKDLRPEYYER